MKIPTDTVTKNEERYVVDLQLNMQFSKLSTFDLWNTNSNSSFFPQDWRCGSVGRRLAWHA